ncbi:S24 family peptidase [Pseudomonas savastanoi pv. phaseolicola]|nr:MULTISPECIES: S24 family peptidase [Pseudomonas]AAZ36653.1 prophage PSPPH03, transcriptional regulator, Cro/CI family [Pseudomonas savastanoi pv. phaseolicola 1448A]KPB40073.1 Prophage PSPPH03 [Pseudomonas savastanoi pv. phaseolicola]KPB46516.1 Prophage PSPPH03 [Pseudomonas savastanoi pv. phaseolicola]KPB68213.1 Prophage PSPPH03 [Pseudomonas savastanoi pv. phaseolicola]KPB74836.1 Prophage PSPPH03 [Pseudomonas amygdali pv. mellea]
MTKKRILPPELLAECAEAHDLFLSKKNELKLSQKKIADEAGMTPAAVNLYFKGINPLNTRFAAVLSRMLQEPVERFSPRLAKEIAALTNAAKPAASQSSVDIVQQMIAKHGKNLPADARQKIADAVEEVAANVPIAEVASRPGAVGDEVSIAHYDVRAAMGGGQIPHDYPEMLQDVRVSPRHLREMGVEFAEHFHLKMVTGWGQSMAPTIKHRDPLLVDISIREFAGDGIYMFSWDGHLYIKRLQWMGDGKIKMISDNTRHPPETIKVDETFIQARVLLVWNANLV